MARYARTLELERGYRLKLDRILDETDRRLVKVYGQSWARLQGRITDLQAEYETLRVAEKNTRNVLAQMRSLKRLQSDIQEELLDYSKWYRVEIRDTHNRVIPFAVEQAENMLDSEMGGVFTNFGRLGSSQVESLAHLLESKAPIGYALAERYGRLAERIREELLGAMIRGEHPSVLARTLRNVYGLGATTAVRTARTFLLMGSREAARAAYAESGIVKGQRRHADFGPRTCLACVLLDDTFVPDGQMLEDHWNGRCSLVPDTFTYKELGFDIPEPGGLSRISGRQWFESQPEDVQRQMMGKGLFEGWKSGQIDLGSIPHRVEDPVIGGMWVPKTLDSFGLGRAA